jgi:hypothetical protein
VSISVTPEAVALIVGAIQALATVAGAYIVRPPRLPATGSAVEPTIRLDRRTAGRLHAGDIIAALSAVLLILSLALTWRVGVDLVGWDVVRSPALLVAVALMVWALLPLRALRVAGAWRTAAAVGIMVCGILAIEAFVLQRVGGNGVGRALALAGGVGVVLGAWLALSAQQSESRDWPSVGEIVAGLGAIVVILSLFFVWDERRGNAWRYGFSDIMIAALAGSVLIMVAARGVLRRELSVPATLAVILIGAVLVHRIGWFRNIVTSDGGLLPWEAGRIVGVIGALTILAGGLASLGAPRSQ